MSHSPQDQKPEQLDSTNQQEEGTGKTLKQANTPDPTYSSRWPETQTLPRDGNVLLIYHGLLCFCYHQGGFCQIGVHTKAPDHEFSIGVYEYDPNVTPPVYKEVYSLEVDPSEVPGQIINIKAVQPIRPGVSFYIPDPQNSHPSQDYDWRWVPDLEGPHFYHGHRLGKEPKALKLKVQVHNGVFLTLTKTCATFERDDGGDDKEPIGNLAFLIGTIISHQEGGHVALQIGPQQLKLHANGGKIYVVVIKNLCPEDKCPYEPSSPIKERRNDFYLYYKAFKVPPRQKEYELKLLHSCDIVNMADATLSLGLGPLRKLLDQITFSSDDAPCGGVSTSRSENLGS